MMSRTFEKIAKLRDVRGRLLVVFGSEPDDPSLRSVALWARNGGRANLVLE